jgi:hypothetical protein
VPGAKALASVGSLAVAQLSQFAPKLLNTRSAMNLSKSIGKDLKDCTPYKTIPRASIQTLWDTFLL